MLSDIERMTLIKAANALESALFDDYYHADRAVSDHRFYERKKTIEDLRKKARE